MPKLIHPITKGYNYKSKAKILIAIIVGVLCLSVLGSIFLDMVVISGNHQAPYPGGSLVTDYVFGVLWAMILGTSILFWPVSSKDRKALLRIWLIKVFITLVVMLAYEYQYFLDPDGYYGGAQSPDFIFEGFTFGNGTVATRQLVWLHLQIFPDSFHAAKVGFSMIGLLGVYLFYRAAVIFLRREHVRILYVLALFPGILFWSSILGKDLVTLLGISLYTYGIIAFHRHGKARHFIMIFGGILIATFIRSWLVPMMVLPLLVFVITRRGNRTWRAGFAIACMFVFFFAITMTGDLWNITSTAGLYDFRSHAAGAFAGGGSTQEAHEIAGLNDILRLLPFGIFTALFRPLPFEVPNIFGFLQSLENVVLLFLMALAVKRTQLKELNDPIILWAISLILIWAALYGLVVSNLGALVRYKLQIYPIFLGLLLYLGRHRVRSALQGDKEFHKN
jgi:hypothetical protein